MEYDKVTDETLREIKSVRDTIKLYEDEILNYFIDWETNASAESLNAKANASVLNLKGSMRYPSSCTVSRKFWPLMRGRWQRR